MGEAAKSNTGKAFSAYPENADSFFTKRNLTISRLPNTIEKEIEKKETTFKVTSAQQYITYINEEIAFWEENDPQNQLNEFSQLSKLKQAKAYFDQAISSYKTYASNPNYGDNAMSQSISQLSSGHLGSKTKLAGALIKHKDKGINFLKGFMAALSSNRTQSAPNSIDGVAGFIAALEYKKVIKQIVTASVQDVVSFEENVRQADENYAKLNAEYVTSFHDQEARVAKFAEEADAQIQTLKEDSEKYFAAQTLRVSELETLYEEKLKLQAPAEYWNEMDRQYNKSGCIWLGVSVGFTLLIIGALILVLKHLPNLFSVDSHWIDVFKNYAILTVITSIAVYILRLLVKMAVSSFHLSRDAKERNKLTYFYLALIEKNAVTEKERAIILNSLFSRADTGLLKGDSSPTMSGNVSELVETMKKMGG